MSKTPRRSNPLSRIREVPLFRKRVKPSGKMYRRKGRKSRPEA